LAWPVVSSSDALQSRGKQVRPWEEEEEEEEEQCVVHHAGGQRTDASRRHVEYNNN